MDYNDLITNMDQMDEETYMSAISYLPAHFGSTKKAISALARLKLDWNIDILETEDGRTVFFEKDLKINVPNEHWDNFLEIFDGKLENSCLNLHAILYEAMNDEINDLIRDLKPTLIRAFTRPPFDEIEEDANRWKVRFKVDSYMQQSVPVSYATKKRDLMKLYQNLLKAYENDIGNMEMLIEAFRDKTPLSAFDIFKQYDYIYGTRIRSNFLGTAMLFEATIDMTFVISETVFIDDQDIVDEAESDIKSIKVVGQVIYPRGDRFDNNFYRILYDIIDGRIENENEF